jgi:hypothetical protein
MITRILSQWGWDFVKLFISQMITLSAITLISFYCNSYNSKTNYNFKKQN